MRSASDPSSKNRAILIIFRLYSFFPYIFFPPPPTVALFMILTFAPVGRLTTLFINIYIYAHCARHYTLCIYIYFFLLNILYIRAPPIRITDGITNYTVDINNKYTYIYINYNINIGLCIRT